MGSPEGRVLLKVPMGCMLILGDGRKQHGTTWAHHLASSQETRNSLFLKGTLELPDWTHNAYGHWTMGRMKPDPNRLDS